MARILITSGPTRQYLDPVRYITNASSGQMGSALAGAAIDAGHEVVVVSGPVHVDYPGDATVVRVTTTEEMLSACQEQFPTCGGMIGVAAPCDYRPEIVAENKIAKTGGPLVLHLVETPDIVATMGADKSPHQWVVGFALETADPHFRAITKLERKRCDLVVLNGPQAIDSHENSVEILAPNGQVIAAPSGAKAAVAREIFAVIQQRLIGSNSKK